MLEENGAWRRQSEGFWRAHHEAWKRSDLNRRRYCEVEGIPLKAFGNWRAQFKAEPQPPERKLLYRRRGLSHPLPLSHPLSHGAYPSSSPGGPIVPRPREGHRRRFSEVDRHRILVTAKMSPGPSFVTFQASGSLAPRSALPHRVSLSPPRDWRTVAPFDFFYNNAIGRRDCCKRGRFRKETRVLRRHCESAYRSVFGKSGLRATRRISFLAKQIVRSERLARSLSLHSPADIEHMSAWSN